MRQHPDTFQAGNLITLQGPSGHTWRVRASDKPIIHSGWRAFAHDHDLRQGDHLCFNLVNSSHFVVEVLDGKGEVKGTALGATNTGKYAVASINNPCDYVRRSRKRKNTMTPPMRTPRRSRRDGFGYGPHGPTIASRCKTTARRRNSNDYPLEVSLKFSDKTKQWVCHEMDGREVVTILDSDDEQVEEENRLLDNIGLSFGSAQLQNYRKSKVQRLMEYMKEQGEYVPQCSIPRVQQIAMAGDDQRMFATAGELGKINHYEIVVHGEEEVAGASELIVCEEAKTVVIAENQVNEASTEKVDFGIDPLPCQTQVSCDQDMTMNKEEDETHLKINVEVKNDLETTYGADSEAFQSHKVPTPSPEGAAAEHESHSTLSVLTENPNLLVMNPSQGLASSIIAVDTTQAEAAGEFLFPALQNIIDMPVVADTTNGGQKRNSAHLLMRDLINQELAQKNFDTRVNDELQLIKSKDTEIQASMLQSSTPSKVHKPSSEFPVTSIQPSHGYGYVASANTGEDEIKRQYLHFLQPPKPTIAHPRRNLEFRRFLNNIVTDSDIRTPKTPDAREKKILQAARNPPPSMKDHTSTDTCVLTSNRGKVGDLDREKTLKAAQAWTKKLRNPNFLAVMQTSNVYHDFIMDIPGEFTKKSRLPATKTKAMLICDEVPTMCKAVWDGTMLNAHAWMEFSRTHYLEEGDVCVFELHNRVAVRIGVHIFRLVGLRRSLLDWTQHYNVVHLGAHHSHVPFSEATVQPGSSPAAALEVL
ncbi:hypothetical protein KC19_11G133400 [Ceratodon purpureus]|uniref:TF-B3 domain-containing protein n=1 Tax=Ceratodon purpureus TaxID=3225 RepID=A0A8T0GK53_CERPU|nr:hypothetical protein KC19_11G133400 [Ceratodon purpureus]